MAPLAQIDGVSMTLEPFLSDDMFAQVVRHAPLISIDLIIRDREHNIFVALRNNEPAKGKYFVPGGRIRKDEKIEAAFARILTAETGIHIPFSETRFIGVYQHLYATNRFDQRGYGTHYIVLAYELRLNERPCVMLDSQHTQYRWMSDAAIKAALDVHANTKDYFR